MENAQEVHDGGGGGEIHVVDRNHEVVALVHHVVAHPQREGQHAGGGALPAGRAGQPVHIVAVFAVIFQEPLHLLHILQFGGEPVLLAAVQVAEVDAEVQGVEVVDGVGDAADGIAADHLVVLVEADGVHPHLQPAFPDEGLPDNVALPTVAFALLVKGGLLQHQRELSQFQPRLVFDQVVHIGGGGVLLQVFQCVRIALVERIQLGGEGFLIHQFERGVLGTPLVHHQVVVGVGDGDIDVGHILFAHLERILEKAVLALGLGEVGVEEQRVLDGGLPLFPLGQLGHQQVVFHGVQGRHILGGLPGELEVVVFDHLLDFRPGSVLRILVRQIDRIDELRRQQFAERAAVDAPLEDGVGDKGGVADHGHDAVLGGGVPDAVRDGDGLGVAVVHRGQQPHHVLAAAFHFAFPALGVRLNQRGVGGGHVRPRAVEAFLLQRLARKGEAHIPAGVFVQFQFVFHMLDGIAPQRHPAEFERGGVRQLVAAVFNVGIVLAALWLVVCLIRKLRLYGFDGFPVLARVHQIGLPQLRQHLAPVVLRGGCGTLFPEGRPDRGFCCLPPGEGDDLAHAVVPQLCVDAAITGLRLHHGGVAVPQLQPEVPVEQGVVRVVEFVVHPDGGHGPVGLHRLLHILVLADFNDFQDIVEVFRRKAVGNHAGPAEVEGAGWGEDGVLAAVPEVRGEVVFGRPAVPETVAERVAVAQVAGTLPDKR